MLFLATSWILWDITVFPNKCHSFNSARTLKNGARQKREYCTPFISCHEATRCIFLEPEALVCANKTVYKNSMQMMQTTRLLRIALLQKLAIVNYLLFDVPCIIQVNSKAVEGQRAVVSDVL